ncbi:hypothetical protein [Cellulomonas carbonis]|uniref:ATP/GTP-binding protein n=1 Tax=Cellulomonas carbonis T26 TaxID=947969 RepID=A0A0A0BSX8_9CELL|nr:hypothetical protein [Cellulomonas carbonis]KGM10757.1 hypothetical protein N868_13960 [Cellulomonas carbonis T26]GGC12165.1 hypothetical protein GCM10010972_26820 [Cellulomonas carbonis]
MPSRRRSTKRPYGDEPPPLDLERALGGRRSESAADGDWTVQRVRGGDKAYTCPGCRQQIPPGTAHVVAWAADGLLGPQAALDDRRHWHSACWQHRARRR